MLPYVVNAGSPAAQFLAGFIFEFTGDNQLTELEQCYQGTQSIISDLETEIQLIQANDLIKAAKLMVQIKNEIQDGVQTCEPGVKKDVAEILDWAQIFDCPAELAITVGKHLLFHCVELARDIKNEKKDMAAQKFFEAGKDTADALILAVGPIKKKVN